MTTTITSSDGMTGMGEMTNQTTIMEDYDPESPPPPPIPHERNNEENKYQIDGDYTLNTATNNGAKVYDPEKYCTSNNNNNPPVQIYAGPPSPSPNNDRANDLYVENNPSKNENKNSSTIEIKSAIDIDEEMGVRSLHDEVDVNLKSNHDEISRDCVGGVDVEMNHEGHEMTTERIEVQARQNPDSSSLPIKHSQQYPMADIDDHDNNFNNYNDHSAETKKTKKPFLKRGSRKEPSALYRFQKDEMSKPKASKSMSSKPSIEEESISNPSDKQIQKYNMETKNNLQRLEDMQRKQIEDLERRIERRERARVEIEQKKKQDVTKTTTRKSNARLEGVTVDANDHLEDDNSHTRSSHSGSYSSFDEFGSCSSSTGTTDSPEGQHQKSLVDERNSKQLPSRSNKNGGRQSISRRSQEHNLKQSQTSTTSRGRAKKDDMKPNLQTPEMMEQWQVIKSMRRRQEAALLDAEKEREEVRAWAQSEREKVKKMTENQQAILKKEKQRAANMAMASQRKKRQETLEEKAAAAVEFSHKRSKEEINSLKETLRKLRVEFDASKSRTRLNEKRLREMISRKEDKICELNEKLHNLQQKNNSIIDQMNEAVRQRRKTEDDLKQEKKKRSKKKASKAQSTSTTSSIQHQTQSTVDLQSDCGRNKKRGIPQSDLTEFSDRHEYDNSNAEKLETVSDESQPKTKKGIANHPQIDNARPDDIDSTPVVISDSCKELIEESTENWLSHHMQGGHQRENHDQIAQYRQVKDQVPSRPKEYDPDNYSTTSALTDLNNANAAVNRFEDSTVATVGVDSTQKPSVTSNDETQDRKFTKQLYPDGRFIETFQNGTQRETLPDGTRVIRFANGDIKTSYKNLGMTVYYYAETKTSHTTHPNGMEMFEFSSGQIERHYPDGKKEVHFPDGSMEIL